MGELILLVLAGIAAIALGNMASRQQPSQAQTRRDVWYRSRDGQSYYRFSIERQVDGTYRSYITSHPEYGSRARNAHATHRLTDSEGRTFVCWSDPLRSEQEALRVAAAWADATQDYINSGRRF